RASISVMFICRITSWGDRSEDAAATSTGASERTGGVRIMVRSDSDEPTLCPTTHEPGLTPRGRTSPTVYRDRAHPHAPPPPTRPPTLQRSPSHASSVPCSIVATAGNRPARADAPVRRADRPRRRRNAPADRTRPRGGRVRRGEPAVPGSGRGGLRSLPSGDH